VADASPADTWTFCCPVPLPTVGQFDPDGARFVTEMTGFRYWTVPVPE
jgi:hypothetical protein